MRGQGLVGTRASILFAAMVVLSRKECERAAGVIKAAVMKVLAKTEMSVPAPPRRSGALILLRYLSYLLQSISHAALSYTLVDRHSIFITAMHPWD